MLVQCGWLPSLLIDAGHHLAAGSQRVRVPMGGSESAVAGQVNGNSGRDLYHHI
jgi:hypothetical protein